MKQNNQAIASQLKQYTQSFIPDLHSSAQGKEYLLTNNIENWESDQQVVIDLYKQIKQSTAEAGHRYWLTRTCTLLCWQPIYVAFISIYGLQHRPDFSVFKQGKINSEMRGICLLSNQFYSDTTEILIKQAGIELSQSFKYYRQLLDDAYRCRPHFMQTLLGDMLLSALLKLKKNSPIKLPSAYILQQSVLWLDAFGLPTTQSSNFIIDPNSGDMTYKRKSCCFVYKKPNSKFCANCPKKSKK